MSFRLSGLEFCLQGEDREMESKKELLEHNRGSTVIISWRPATFSDTFLEESLGVKESS